MPVMFEKRFVLLTISTTFLLLLLGGIVHNTGSSLACPDWPLCYGQFFPKMEGGILIEHGHRLLASFVGLLTILNASIVRKKLGKWHPVSKLSYLAILLVILQGLLGGITVIFKLPTLVSTAHLGLSLIFFSTLIFIHHQLSMNTNIGEESQSMKSVFAQLSPSLVKGIIFSVALVFFQIILGAFMRHSGAGASCGLGWNYSLLCLNPSANFNKVWWPENLPAKLHMFHRIVAIFVAFYLFTTTTKVIRFFYRPKLMEGLDQRTRNKILQIIFLSLGSQFLVLTQIILGILVVAKYIDVSLTTAHLGVAALLLACLLKLSLILISGMKSLGPKENNFWRLAFDLFEMTKPKLSGLVLITVLVGMFSVPTPFSTGKNIIVLLLIGMLVGGACVINCYLERDVDKLMLRTKNRALPSGRVSSRLALIFGVSLLATSLPLLLYFTNPLTVILGVVAACSYIFCYTPLKKKSSLALLIGAIPGALPPVLGWTAVSGTINPMALYFFLMMFLWQLSHFLAISIYHLNDYKAASIKVLPFAKGISFTKKTMLFSTLLLAGVSLIPFYMGFADVFYKNFSILLGFLFLAFSLYGFIIGENVERNRLWARRYFLASLFYLPTVFGAMLFFK